MTEHELQMQESAGVLAYFLAVQFSKNLFDSYMHSYIGSIKDKVHGKQANDTRSAKEKAVSKKRAKRMIQNFSDFSKVTTEIMKIVRMNPELAHIYEDRSNAMYLDLEKKMKRVFLNELNNIASKYEKYYGKDHEVDNRFTI